MGELKFSLCFLLLSLIPSCLPHGPVQYQKQTDYGTYKYGYDTGNHGAHSFKQEHRGFDGVVHGRYGYTDADGKLRYVEYSAGPFGFRVKGDNEPSYYTEDGLPRSEYKVPTDTELTDLDAGLAKIAKQQLFGVPVQPYVKGYVGSPPPEAAKVQVVQPAPPHIVQVPVPPPVKSISVVPPAPVLVEVPPRVVVRVKADGGRPYIKGELPPHRRKVVVKSKPRIPDQPVVPFQPVVHVVPPQPVVPIKSYVPPPAVVVRQELFDKPVSHLTKGYVPPPPPPPPQQVIVREEIFPQPVPEYTKGYVAPPPVQVVKSYVPPPPPPPPPVQVIKSYVPPPPPPPPPRVVVPAYTKGYVPPPHQPPVIVRQEIFEKPVPVYTKGYVAPPPVQRPVPVIPKSIVREQIFERPVPVVPKTVVREQIFERPVPVVPKTIVREQIFERPVPVAPKTIVREQIFERPVPVVPKTIVREFPVPPKSIVREQIFARPVPEYTKGYVPPPQVIVREEVIPRPRPVQHPKGFVPVPRVKGYVPPPPRVFIAPRPQSLYVKGFVTTPRPFAAPVRPVHVPVSSKTLFNVPAPKYTKGYVPEIRRQTEKGTIVTVHTPVSSHTGRSVSARGETGDGLRWVAAPEDRYRPEYREYGPPPAYAYAPY